MPTRRQSAAATAVEEPEPEPEESGEDERGGLRFNESLSWRAAKPIPVADLLRRLQDLSQELRLKDQEEVDRGVFTKVAKELVGQGLLGHKDRGIRAWTACCLVDILRLCAPDAPYTAVQLKDIFSLFINSILPSLADPSNAYNTQHLYVLQSLAQVKSVVLLTDVPGSDALILNLFASFFDVASGSSKSSTAERISKNNEYYMTAILAILVDEAPSLPSEVIDIVMAQFLRTDPRAMVNGPQKGKKDAVLSENQSTLLQQEPPPAYNMAKAVCRSCEEKMARHVSQYFNDVIMDVSSMVGSGNAHQHRKASYSREDSDDETPNGPSEEDLKELNKAHRLLRELWKAAPGVLQNVIPQLNVELSTENVQLRLLATETIGDIISGIGAAGPPNPPQMDPSTYPPVSISSSTTFGATNALTHPVSPQVFAVTHPAAYNGFISRKNDKSALVRASWAASAGWILITSAGGVGISQGDEKMLVKDLAQKLQDSDEKVRISAIRVVSRFGLNGVVSKLCADGGIDESGSVLSNLADRARDRRHNVRVESMTLLAQLWGAAFGEIARGNETVKKAIGSIPSKLFDTFYINDQEVNVLLDHITFEQLLPLNYPPAKSKPARSTQAENQRSQKSTNGNGMASSETYDPDKIRTERILQLVVGLDVKAKKAFFAVQARQVPLAGAMHSLLKRCEEYNGGVMEDNESEIKKNLDRLISWLAQLLPDSARVAADLWKFAKAHDRRSYQLIRFCMDPDSDYRTAQKAIKELTKRMETGSGTSAAMLETIKPLLYRVSLLVYNKSHVPAIVALSRTEVDGLNTSAHEILKEISVRNPEVFKAHIKELCQILEEQAPTAKKPNDVGTVDTLKACAGFSQKFPNELPQERKFYQALVNYAVHGVPPRAAKHSVTILMASSNRKELHIKDLAHKSLEGIKYGQPNLLARLATLSQLALLAPQEISDDIEKIKSFVTKDILLNVRTPAKDSQTEWHGDEDLDEEYQAKFWSCKILANLVRSHTDAGTLGEVARPALDLLNKLVQSEGEIMPKETTPLAHKTRLRLLAATLLLKICGTKNQELSREFDSLLGPTEFNQLACMSQASQAPVREGFIDKLKKYLGSNRLSQRFYTMPFLLAFEPQQPFRGETVTWIRSRAVLFAQQRKPYMEGVFARLLSLLAHHPDFTMAAEDLVDFARYIVFYLQCVASEKNLPLIYFVAQRVKQTRDAIRPTQSENLYYLSDLAQEIIRRYEDAQGWVMQTWPGSMKLPSSLFGPMPDHNTAQDVAMKTYLPEGIDDELEALVKTKLKSKKRKSTDATAAMNAGQNKAKRPKRIDGDNHESKSKNRPAARKKKSRVDAENQSPSERRRSSRAGAGRTSTYRELSSDEEEDEAAAEGDEETEEVEEAGDKFLEEEDGMEVEGSGSEKPEEENHEHEQEREEEEGEEQHFSPPSSRRKSLSKAQTSSKTSPRLQTSSLPTRTRGRGPRDKPNGKPQSTPPSSGRRATRNTRARSTNLSSPIS